MPTAQQLLQQEFSNILANDFQVEINVDDIQIQKTRKDFEGDFTLVVFPLVRHLKSSPEAAGKTLGEAIVKNLDLIEKFNVVKGFLNLSFHDSFWVNDINETLASSNLRLPEASSNSHVMVEYSSPNTNKPLHLGHLRNNFLGYSVAEILKANGHKVTKVQIVNDRGIHICKSMLAWQKFGEGSTPESTGLKGDKLVGNYYVKFNDVYKEQIVELEAAGYSNEEAGKNAPLLLEAQEMLLKWEQNDPEVRKLWSMMNGWVYDGFKQTYTDMGVDFDKLYFESDTYLKGKSLVEKGLEEGKFFKKDNGSIWVDLSSDGLDEKLLLRGDGTAVYMTQDIGTAVLRFEDFEDLSYQIYTVGNEQEYHFKVLFLVLEKLGFAQAKNNFHLSYGMVELPEGKMKSREGTVVDADELLEEMKQTAKEIADEQGKLDHLEDGEKDKLYEAIGYGGLKYFLLKVDPVKTLLFDPKESIDFNGNTGAYIQFNYVRTRSLLRKSELTSFESIAPDLQLTEDERELCRKLYDFREQVDEAAKAYSPALMANYCYDLVRTYSSYYQKTPILKEEDEDLRKMRLSLTHLCGAVLKRGMGMLGIEMPEYM